MSWDQQAYSLGNQPPTPTRTPTSATFPTPTVQTPRNSNSNFESRGGWTPTFAEEYSVFNATPGRLTQGPFNDVSTPRPLNTSTQNRRLSSTGDIAAELATHVHLSPNLSLHLPPVNPSSQLPSSPASNSASSGRFDDLSVQNVTPRKPKKLEGAFSVQTATPPQSRPRGSRKLAPKILTETMQHDSQDGHYGTGPPNQNSDLMSFSSNSTNMFGYPMSAPATAPVYTNTKSFWGPDASMSGMDLDFTVEDANIFNVGSHRISNSVDWGRDNQAFQDIVNLPPSQDTHTQPAPKRQRPLASKPPSLSEEHPIPPPQFGFNNPSNSNNPFSVATLDGAVDPGLLFSRHNSSSMSSGFEDVTLPASRPATSHVVREPYQHQLRESRRDQEELRRSRNTRDSSSGYRLDRGTMSSPVKGSARPGLQRSVSDNRGRKTQDRVISRTGRCSPIKHQRPTSLTSIAESPTPSPRTEVKFTIDANGRARTETIIISEESSVSRARQPLDRTEGFDSSQDDSSTDEEPIILPSRNTSFNLPPQPRRSKLARFETYSRGNDPRSHSVSVSGYSQSETSSQNSGGFDSVESDAETVIEEDDGSGDATRELRKVMESRKKRQVKSRSTHPHLLSSDRTPKGVRHYSNYSPTTATDGESATPSSTRSGSTRCVCNNADNDGFMIQCESCDNWLHTQCVGIDSRNLPTVYICSFCALTPNMRNGRIRESAKSATNLTSSPLTHKSFKSFR